MDCPIRTKLIFDPIHGYMRFGGNALSILDTSLFKRLQNIRQLGACYNVFPGASHNRFEHSLGVAHLAEKMIDGIRTRQPELNITHREVELVKLAGLCHDLGHGPFSHAFDSEILPRLVPARQVTSHEERSGLLLHQIIQSSTLDITEDEYEFIQRCIHPTKDEVRFAHRPFLYEIVANPINGIDVDKFDYLQRDPYNLGLDYHFNCDRLIDQARVIDGHVCFPEKVGSLILHMASVRYRLLREVCNHPVVKAIEYMVTDSILAAEPVLGLAEKTLTLDFCLVTDQILYAIQMNTSAETEEARGLLDRIQSRDLYSYVGELASQTDKCITPELLEEHGVSESDIRVHHMCLSYTNTKVFPLESVGFYKMSAPDTVTHLSQENMAMILPSSFCESNTIRIFSVANHEAVLNMYTILKARVA